jgi:hypothetical protein
MAARTSGRTPAAFSLDGGNHSRGEPCPSRTGKGVVTQTESRDGGFAGVSQIHLSRQAQRWRSDLATAAIGRSLPSASRSRSCQSGQPARKGGVERFALLPLTVCRGPPAAVRQDSEMLVWLLAIANLETPRYHPAPRDV